MKRRIPGTQMLAAALFVIACALGIASQQRSGEDEAQVPRAQWQDATPLGGKGLRLLLGQLGYTVKRTDERLKTMPKDARVWMLLDPHSTFSRDEAKRLLQWVKNGGTLLWAASPTWYRYASDLDSVLGTMPGEESIRYLNRELLNDERDEYSPRAVPRGDELLPPLTPLTPAAVSIYWSGVRKAAGSGGGVTVKQPYLEIAGTSVDVELARIDYGKGRVFVTPDAMLFTNYALSRPDNAILMTNLIRVHEPAGKGAVYFDERRHGDIVKREVPPSLPYYLSRPPLSYAVLQLLGAALLVWALYGRRLGAPVPLPEREPVTRASQFALAMGGLFRKVNRPRAAGAAVGEEFRRAVTRRLGMSIADPDSAIAERAAAATGLPSRTIDRLLLQARAPAEHEADVLSDVQEMELVLRRLNRIE